jgi:hypothetical protein
VVVSTPRTVRAFEPAWAPDGNRIAFLNGFTGISVIGADGTGLTRVTTQNLDRGPAWSPDGRRIAFERREGRFVRLFVVNADGSGLRGVTMSLDVHVQDPEWSPDGSLFTFSNGFDIYVVNADGTGLRNLTEGLAETGRASQPSWSPDGSLIAYGTQRAVKVVSPDGGGLRELLGGLREVWELSWSPRGTRIAFINDPGGALQEELYVVNADGSGVRRTGVDTDTDLDWGRAATGPPPPQVGKTVNIAPVSGTVRVRLRGRRGFVNLARLRQVPVGSELDVRRGRVRLVSAAGRGRTQTGQFFQGRAIVRQPRGRTPVTTLQLSGPLACPRSVSAAGAPPPRTRRLWGNAKGRFRTSGRFASAVVRGTVWLTEDRCDGTFVRVRIGRVEVFDVVRKRRVIVRAGQSYLARAR